MCNQQHEEIPEDARAASNSVGCDAYCIVRSGGRREREEADDFIDFDDAVHIFHFPLEQKMVAREKKLLILVLASLSLALFGHTAHDGPGRLAGTTDRPMQDLLLLDQQLQPKNSPLIVSAFHQEPQQQEKLQSLSKQDVLIMLEEKHGTYKHHCRAVAKETGLWVVKRHTTNELKRPVTRISLRTQVADCRSMKMSPYTLAFTPPPRRDVRMVPFTSLLGVEERPIILAHPWTSRALG